MIFLSRKSKLEAQNRERGSSLFLCWSQFITCADLSFSTHQRRPVDSFSSSPCVDQTLLNLNRFLCQSSEKQSRLLQLRMFWSSYHFFLNFVLLSGEWIKHCTGNAACAGKAMIFIKMKISIHKSVCFWNNNDDIMLRLRGIELRGEMKIASRHVILKLRGQNWEFLNFFPENISFLTLVKPLISQWYTLIFSLLYNVAAVAICRWIHCVMNNIMKLISFERARFLLSSFCPHPLLGDEIKSFWNIFLVSLPLFASETRKLHFYCMKEEEWPLDKNEKQN